ncbi:MAG: hypothetical protein FK730_05915 [Asgard group archaeon]|nr:hypothetical protein [Asgard group archaeon]
MRKRFGILLALSIIILTFFTSFTIVYSFGSMKKLNLGSESLTFRMGFSYPPLKNDKQKKITQYHCQKLDINLIRTGLGWNYIEANEGTFTWSGFDKRMNFFRDNGIDILLTIDSYGPEWNNDLETPKSSTFKNVTAFEVFLRALFNRYKSYNIHKIAFGNEWVSDYQFIGTAEQYVNYSNTVYNIASEIIPTATFVLGGLATSCLRLAAAYYNYTDSYWSEEDREIITGSDLQELLSSEGVLKGISKVTYVLANSTYDELDIHLYDDYESWGIYTTMMKDLVPGKPIIVSEFGGPNIFWEKYSNKKQAVHLNYSISVLNELDIEEAYYFKLVQSGTSTPQHRKSSLLNNLLTIKPAYYVMQSFTKGDYDSDFRYYTKYSLIPTAFVSTALIFTLLGIIIKKKIIKRKLRIEKFEKI